MNQAWDDFNPSSSLRVSMPCPFTTRFRYPIIEDKHKKAAKAGIKELKRCAPYVVAFNEKFIRIDIKDHDETLSFEVVDHLSLDTIGIQQITVIESKNGKSTERKYLTAQGEKKTSVTVPLESNGDRSVCLPVEETPRLFSAFPLVGTESFSFPAVINNWDFKSREDRDGVSLGQSDNEANHNNQAIIEEACSLLIDLLQFAVSRGWHHVHQWTEIRAIEDKDWLNTEWLRTCIKEKFIEKIRETDVVLNADDNVIAPNAARLPLLNLEKGEEVEVSREVEVLWDLLESVQGFRETLPRQEEAAGWCNTLQSWASLYDQETSKFDEAFDGRQLAQVVHNMSHDTDVQPETHRVSRLKLKEGVDKIHWLDSFIDFLQKNGLDEVIRQYWIVPSQESFLRPLDRLDRDQGIDDNLKDIAELLKWRIRPELRDRRLNSLIEKEGREDIDCDKVVDTLCEKLRARADENPDNDFKEACKRLFAWIVLQEDWDRLRGFPVFTDDSKSNSSSVLHLPSAHTSRPLLAPLRAWAGDLEPFKDLFPPERILADAFFEVVIKPDAWKELDNRHLIKSEKIIIDDNSDDLKLFSPEVYEDEDNKKIHEIDMPFDTTDILEWNEIMRNARSNRDNSYLFWRFLTEYIIKKDSLVVCHI